jgi:hypothetical protein
VCHTRSDGLIRNKQSTTVHPYAVAAAKISCRRSAHDSRQLGCDKTHQMGHDPTRNTALSVITISQQSATHAVAYCSTTQPIHNTDSCLPLMAASSHLTMSHIQRQQLYSSPIMAVCGDTTGVVMHHNPSSASHTTGAACCCGKLTRHYPSFLTIEPRRPPLHMGEGRSPQCM